MNKETLKKLERFFKDYRLQEYKKGEVILKPEESLPGICYIKEGYVRLYTVTKDGQEVTIQLFKPVFFFSLIYAMTGVNNRYYFEAISPVSMWVAPKEEALRFFREETEVYEDIIKSILLGFLDLTVNIEQLLSGNAYTKVARLIYSLSNNYSENKGKKTEVDFGITHRIIASLTGLTRETVTLQMLKLEKEGVIDNKGKKIMVKDLNELKKVAEI